MTRLAYTVDNQYIEEIRSIERDLREKKNRQFTSGRSGVVGYITQNPGLFDISQALASPSPTFGYSAEFEITFTGNKKQKYPFVTPYVDLYFNAITETNRLKRSQDGSLYWTDGTNNVRAYSWLKPNNTIYADEYVSKWTLGFTYMGSMTYFMKVYAAGSNSGTISVVRTY